MAKRAGEASSSREASSSGERWPPDVLPEHTIFLSHSGHDKPFVERLCEELKRLNHSPFFDQNSDSLPRGERFPPHLFKAAEQCLLAVIVLSEGYLTSKWPMLELAAFVKAKELKNPSMKLLPLFYKLSPSDLVPEQWMESWKKLADDGKIHAKEIELWSKGTELLVQAKNVETGGIRSSTQYDEEDEITLGVFPDQLTEVVNGLRPFNGLEFSKYGTSEGRYIKAVVDEIFTIIPPMMKSNTDGIRGYQRMCEKVSSMFEEGIPTNVFCQPGRLYLGLYGMGGVGKTTLCEAMCSFYQVEFRGRVCHVELQDDTERDRIERLKHVIRELGGFDDRVLQGITRESEGWGCLQERSERQPAAFLAVDNVGDSESSREEARRFIGCGLACGSKVMVTSRSLSILESVLGEAKYCKPIPRLEEQEAEELFLSMAIPRKMPSRLQPCEDLIVKVCIQECKFSDDGYDTQQYHPLVLRVLGIFFQDFDIMEWKEALKVEKKLQESRESKRVNDILGLNYSNLSAGQKLLFLDVAFLFNYEKRFLGFINKVMRPWEDEYQWAISLLAAMHGISTFDVKRKVKELQRKSLIYESSSSLRTHDLYTEFAQSLVSVEGSKEREWWVGHKDANGNRTTLKRLVLLDDKSKIIHPPQLWECPNLECLIMMHCRGTLSSKLDLKCFPNLRVLIILGGTEMAVLCVGDDAVDFDFDLHGPKNQIEGCLPELRRVHLSGFDFRRIRFLRQCWNLTSLSINNFDFTLDKHQDVDSLFENLKALETLFLTSSQSCRLPASTYSKILRCAAAMEALKYLQIDSKFSRNKLDEIDKTFSGGGYVVRELHLSALRSLTVLSLPYLPVCIKELVGLDQLSQLTSLDLDCCKGLSKLANLDLLPNLAKICVEGCVNLEHPKGQLERFQRLHSGFAPSHQCLEPSKSISLRY